MGTRSAHHGQGVGALAQRREQFGVVFVGGPPQPRCHRPVGAAASEGGPRGAATAAAAPVARACGASLCGAPHRRAGGSTEGRPNIEDTHWSLPDAPPGGARRAAPPLTLRAV